MPPILELFILWHPGDAAGARIGQDLLNHFHTRPFTGLMRDGVEVYFRSRGWAGPQDAPRGIPFPGSPGAAAFVGVVPVLGRALADAVEDVAGPWHGYLAELRRAKEASGGRVGVFPVLIETDGDVAGAGTVLGGFFPTTQQLARPDPAAPPEPRAELIRRDLTQGLVRLLTGVAAKRLTVFISHTKHETVAGEHDVADLIAATKKVLGGTRLATFFDAKDLEPGSDWAEALRHHAATSALLVLRTDLYASRPWCQTEVVQAKQAGMPVLVLDALCHGEERGSFLLDHVPRLPVRREGDAWKEGDLRAGVNRLVDECLKRALWSRQEQETPPVPGGVDWWAPHAPEAVTLIGWLQGKRAAAANPLRVLHPDPPLVEEERKVLDEIAVLAGYSALDALTPHTLAARGGGTGFAVEKRP